MNLLQTLPQGIFDKMKNLSKIYLNCNHLMYLPDHLLKNKKLFSSFKLDNSICYNSETSEQALPLQESVFSSPLLNWDVLANLEFGN